MSTADEAAERLRRQAASRPGDPLVRARLAAETEGEESRRATEDAVRLARACLDAGLTAPARETAEALFARAPEGAGHAALLIDAALREGQADGLARAAEVAGAWVGREPGSVEARLRAALVAAATGQAKAVSAWLAPVLETSVEARMLSAQAHLADGDPERALAAVGLGWPDAAAAPDRRASADLLEIAGVAWLELGHAERALDVFAQALAQAPDRPSIAYNMAVAFAHSGSLGAAIGACDTALAWIARAREIRPKPLGGGPDLPEQAEEARVEALRQALVGRLAAGLATGGSSA